MASRLHAIVLTLAFTALVGHGHGSAAAADRTDVDAATRQVERGAEQIGQGQVLEGAEETAKGIGNTIVEGTKYTGQKLADAGRAAGSDARTAWDRTKEGAVAFASSLREFFSDLFAD